MQGRKVFSTVLALGITAWVSSGCGTYRADRDDSRAWTRGRDWDPDRDPDWRSYRDRAWVRDPELDLPEGGWKGERERDMDWQRP